jgi:hypothetical protein
VPSTGELSTGFHGWFKRANCGDWRDSKFLNDQGNR